MTDAKRKELKAKIAASEARNDNRTQASLLDRAGEKAIEAKDKVGAFVREHPITTVVGGVAVGILVSGMFKRSPTRKLGAKAAGRAATLAAIAADLALAYAQQALTTVNDAGRAGADKIGDLGDSLGDTARSIKREAVHRAGNASDGVRIVQRETAKRVARAVRNRIH